MALIRRFTLRPDQQAAINKDVQEQQAAVPVEEKLAIEIMVPETPKPEPKEEVPAADPIPEKILAEEPVKEEAPAEPEQETTKKEEPVKETTEKAPAEPVEEEPKETEKKTKRTRKTTKKAEPAEENIDMVYVSNDLGTSTEVTDVMKEVAPKYVDTAFDEFKEKLEHDLRLTKFDEKTDTGMIRIIIMHLNRCFENVTNEYARVNTNLEQLTNKTYGLITRQIILNSNGINEISRKQNGVRAPEVYKTPDGREINLYALQAALEAETAYLKAQMQVLEYRRSTLISYLTANKIEAGLIGD